MIAGGTEGTSNGGDVAVTGGVLEGAGGAKEGLDEEGIKGGNVAVTAGGVEAGVEEGGNAARGEAEGVVPAVGVMAGGGTLNLMAGVSAAGGGPRFVVEGGAATVGADVGVTAETGAGTGWLVVATVAMVLKHTNAHRTLPAIE